VKKKVSLAFTLLAVHALLTLSNVLYIFSGLGNLFRNFSIMGVVSYIISGASALLPLALLAVLYLNTKQDAKKLAATVCLAGAALKFYSCYKVTKNIIMVLMSGADIFAIWGQLCSLAMSLTVAVLFIFAYQEISQGKKHAARWLIAIVGGFIFFFFTAVMLLIGGSSIGNFVSGIVLLMGLCYLPATIVDRKKAVMTTQKSLKPVIIILVVALLIVAIAGVMGGSPSSGSSSGNSRSCGYCGRSFSDSGNTRSIARTGMCSNCTGNYKSMTNWLDSMG
jgi:hypothetical protein